MADKYLNYTGLAYYHNRIKTQFASQDDLDTLQSQVDDLVTEGGEPNVIESISVNGTPQTVSNKSVDITVPTQTSELTNNSGFITNQVNDLVNYYTSSNTYSKSEVDDLIGGITGIEFEIVTSLPQSASAGTIYLLSNSGTAPNVYDEYVYVGGNWEKIGSTDIDLSQYWSKSELVAITTAEIDTITA